MTTGSRIAPCAAVQWRSRSLSRFVGGTFVPPRVLNGLIMSKSANGPRTALVTGATDGLGYETARLLAAENYHVIVHGPTTHHAEDAIERLIKDGADPLRLHTAAADFANFSQVATMAHMVSEAHPRLDVLVNNAAIAGPERRETTEDGHELTWQVNYLAPYLLTAMLERQLAKALQSRVVNVSSSLHARANLEPADLNETRRYLRHAAYARSKLALTMFTKGLTLYGPTSLTAISVHPGILDTALLSTYSDTGRHASDGAHVVAQLCTQTKVINGGYYNERSMPARPAAVVENLGAVQRLWRISASLTGMG
jgi:NAD(P)-dependent dehydrogenase (short-subunit alcohol dehydrogenase family)